MLICRRLEQVLFGVGRSWQPEAWQWHLADVGVLANDRSAPEAAVQEKRRCRSLLSHVGGIRLLSCMLTVEHQG